MENMLILMNIEKIKMNDNKIYTKNRNVYNEYEVIFSFEAGMVLKGHDVKAIRESAVNIGTAYAVINNNEVILNNIQLYGLSHNVKLLLNKNEINKVSKEMEVVGTALVPLSLYSNKNRIKCELAVARGFKKYDKRENIKKKELEKSTKYKIKT